MTPAADREAKAIGMALLGAALLFGLALLLRSRADWSLDLPVNPIPGVFGLLMLAYSATVVTLRPHHVVIWGSLAVAGLLPVWSGDDPSNVGLVHVRRGGHGQRRLRPPHDRPHAGPRHAAHRWLTSSSPSTGSCTSRGGWRS